MSFIWQALVDRARVYIDDDHDETPEGFLSSTAWLAIANAEYAQQYRDWVRMALISPAPVDTSFTTYTTTKTGVLATIGVAEDFGSGRMRVLTPAQSVYGRAPFWGYTDSGSALFWSATGTADDMTYILEPRTTANYVLRTIATPTPAASLTGTVDVPFGLDERLALGIARRAKLKDGATSALLERLILEADARTNMAAFSRANGDSPRVRRVQGTAPRSTSFSTDPRFWRFS